MIDLIKKAEAWIEEKGNSDSITNQDVKSFVKGNLTLETICNCLIDPDHKEELKNYLNKSELTDLDQLDLIDSLKDFPDWFFVFLPKDNLHVANILYSYHKEEELSKEIIEYVESNYNYIEQLNRYLVFEREIFFKYRHKLDRNESITEYFTKIDENISQMNEIILENISIEKMRHFILDEYIDSPPMVFNNIIELLYENLEKYSELFPKEFKEIDKESASQELFNRFMPQDLKFTGFYLFKKDFIKYALNENPLQLIEDLLLYYVENKIDNKNELRKLKAKTAYTTGKIVVGLIPGAGIISNIKDAVEAVDMLKDAVEGSSDIIDYNFQSVKLSELLKEFEKSEKITFREYFINSTKKSIYNTVESEWNLKISLSTDVFDTLYNQFLNQYIGEDLINEIKENFPEQYEESDDKDLYAIQYLFNR